MQIGLTADEVLRLPGWGGAAAVRPPEVVGEDDDGIIVRWHYWDTILTLERREECYRVTAIEGRGFWGKLWWQIVRGRQ